MLCHELVLLKGNFSEWMAAAAECLGSGGKRRVELACLGAVNLTISRFSSQELRQVLTCEYMRDGRKLLFSVHQLQVCRVPRFG